MRRVYLEAVSESRVYFYEVFAEEQEALQRRMSSRVAAAFTDKTIQEEGMPDPPAGCISIRTQSCVPERWLNQLDGILSRSTGYDHLVGLPGTRGGGRPHCACLPSYCSRAVAEQAVLLWMALLRRLPAQRRAFQTFHRDGLTGFECRGKTLAVIGVGHIGIEIVRLGEALGMSVLGVDIDQRHAGVRYLPPDQALPRADVIVCAMNLTTVNRGYFSYDVLKTSKQGAVFINIARGELAPTKDLLRLCDEEWLGGVGLDVYDGEAHLATALRGHRPPTAPEAQAALDLAARDDVILTPHNAFNTREALDRKADLTMAQLEAFLDTGRFKWPIEGGNKV